MLNIGDTAPSFSLDSNLGHIDSQSLAGQRYVLFFYPKDDTPGCTAEACSFRDQAYGVWIEKSMYGKKYMGIQRSTFVVSPDGRIEHVWEKVKPEDHADEVLRSLASDG